MRVISPYTATITLNGKRLDSPIKWHRVSLGKEKEKRKKKKPKYMLLSRDLVQVKRHTYAQSEGTGDRPSE